MSVELATSLLTDMTQMVHAVKADLAWLRCFTRCVEQVFVLPIRHQSLDYLAKCLDKRELLLPLVRLISFSLDSF